MIFQSLLCRILVLGFVVFPVALGGFCCCFVAAPAGPNGPIAMSCCGSEALPAEADESTGPCDCEGLSEASMPALVGLAPPLEGEAPPPGEGAHEEAIELVLGTTPREPLPPPGCPLYLRLTVFLS